MHAARLLRRNGADPSTLRPRLIKERGALCWSQLRFLLNDWRGVSLLCFDVPDRKRVRHAILKGIKGKGKDHPRTGHEGPEVK